MDPSVLLWTRAYPITNGPDNPNENIPVCVNFKIFDNAELSGRPIDSAEAFTTYDVDFTVKLEVTGLKPDSHYWFQFADCTDANTRSSVGLTRTLSSANSEFTLKRSA